MKNLEDILKRCDRACSENKTREQFLGECELIVCEIFNRSRSLREGQVTTNLSCTIQSAVDPWQERCERAEARIDKLMDILNTWRPK